MSSELSSDVERRDWRTRILRIVIIDVVIAAILVGLYFLAIRPAPAAEVELVDGRIIGSTAPSFTLDSPEGQRIALEQYRGRPVILNFWATWCEPCKEEIPALDAVGRSSGAAVIGVSVSDTAQAVMDFRRTVPFDYPVALDSDQAITRAYRVRNLPTTYFLDERGVIRDAHVGPLTEEAALERLKAVTRS